MALNFSSWQSLKARVTVFTLTIFVISIWALAFYTSKLLQKDLERQSGEAQSSTVSLVATDINIELEERVQILETVARDIDQSMLKDPVNLQRMLEKNQVALDHFNAGILAISIDGMCVADVPVAAGRKGTNYSNNEADHIALMEGRPAISGPMMGRKLKQPLFNIAAPIRDADGKVIGALTGVINLALPNFLDTIGAHSYGISGGYLVVDPKHKLFVTATDKTRVMQSVPSPGSSLSFDRRMSGYYEPVVALNSLGVENLSSAAPIPAAGWFVIAALPTQEAFSSIGHLKQRIQIGTAVLTLLAGLLTWWMIRHQLSPMLAAAQRLITLSDTHQHGQRLPVARRDEIGQLIEGFNRLLKTLEIREEALEQASNRNEAFLRNASDGVHILDADGNVLEVSDSFCSMLGYSRDELVGANASLWDAQWSSHELKRETNERKTNIGRSAFETKYRRQDGSFVEVEITGHRLELDGKTALFNSARDITVRKHLAARHSQTQKLEALGTLAGGIAHDFNNALATILGNLELARQDVGPGHVALESLEEIGKASRRAKVLVQQILTFGQRQSIKRKVISLVPVVKEVSKMLRATLPAGVGLNVDCTTDAPRVLANSTQIEQALLNLCTNAWHAIESQDRTGVIEIRLAGEVRNGQEFASLMVRDNGQGMNEMTLARIFEPFFTTKSPSKGTGLGLSVVHGVVQEHEAQIEVQSTLEHGTTIVIYIPAAQVSIDKVSRRDPQREEEDSGEVPKMLAEGRHILYIDDEEAIVSMMKRLLERQGYRVSGFTDPHEALASALAKPSQFDLMVTDYNMPGMSGLEVASALREVRADMPIAMASGYITDELREKAWVVGIDELIYKPNTVTELCATVARLAQTTRSRSMYP